MKVLVFSNTSSFCIEGEVGEGCSMHTTDLTGMWKFDWETWREKTTWEMKV